MSDTGPRLFADERGVWRSIEGQLTGIEWGEVYRVRGYKLDGITGVYTCVDLDWECGEFIELYHDWPGFQQVTSAITARLAGIATDWLQKIEQLDVNDAPVEVWCRA
jgi:hypothetical protein